MPDDGPGAPLARPAEAPDAEGQIVRAVLEANVPDVDVRERCWAAYVAARQEFARQADAEERRRLLREFSEVRRTLGITQQELAARMGSTQAAVSRFELGDYDPRLSTTQRYAAALGYRLRLALVRDL